MRKIVVVWLVVVGLFLSACSPAMLPRSEPDALGGGGLSIGLPRIVVTANEQGKLGIEGFLNLQQLDQMASSLGLPLGLSSFSLPPDLVRRMMLGGIQHVEVRQTADKLVLLFNGEPMPSLSWKDGSLDNLGLLLELLGPQAAQIGQMVQRLAPLTERLGLSIAVKFPSPPGVAAIPYASEETIFEEPEPATGTPAMLLQFEVKYNEDGVPSFLGIPYEEVQALFGGQPLRLALDPKVIERAQANNIQHLEVRSKGDGLWVRVNSEALPPIRWDKQTLSNAIDAWVKMNPGLSPLAAKSVQTIAPFLSNADVSILMHFPLAPGAEPIPVQMQ